MSLNIAHRGASGYRKENTIEAFELAIHLRCDGIETDVQLSKDGIPVLIHDEKVDRTTIGKGFVKDFTAKSLQLLGVPLLEELLVLAKKNSVLLNLELKNSSVLYPGLEEKVIELVHKYDMRESILLSSFNHYSIVKCKALDSKIEAGVLYVEPLYQPEKYCQGVGANAIHPHYRTLNYEIVKKAHNAGIKVNPYTINEEEDIRYMIELGVDMIISNYPDRVKECLLGK